MSGTRHLDPPSVQFLDSPRRNSLASRGGLTFYRLPDARLLVPLTGQNIGADNFSKSFFAKVPTSNPSVSMNVMSLGASATDFTSSGGTVTNVAWHTDGSIRIDVGNGSGNFRTWSVAGVVAVYGGKTVHVVVIRSGTTPIVWINGTQQVVTGSGSGGTPPDYSLSITSSYMAFGYSASGSGNALEGNIYGATLYNMALTAADVLEIYERGGAVPERYRYGSQDAFAESLRYANQTNLSYNVTSVTSITSTGFTVATSGDQYVAVALMGYRALSDYYSAKFPGVWAVGQTLDVSLTLTVNSGTTPSIQLPYAGGGGTFSPATAVLAAGANSFSHTRTDMGGAANADGHLGIRSNGTSNYTISNLVGKLRGAIWHSFMDDGYGMQIQDLSYNQLHGVLSALGVIHTLPVNTPVRVRGTTNTNGNQQMFGLNVIKAQSQITRIRARSRSGTPTITIGSASGGSQFVASVALSTTWKNLTVALADGYTGATDSAIWVGSNSTDVVEIDIDLEPLSS